MTDLPPWPGPLTRGSTWGDVYDRLLHHEAEREVMQMRTWPWKDDQMSQDDPPPKPEPKPEDD